MKIIIIGTGGFAKEVYLLIKDLNLKKSFYGFGEPKHLIKNDTFLKYPVLSYSEIDYQKFKIVIAIGDPILRKKIAESELSKKSNYVSLISKRSFIGDNVEIGTGSIIMPFSYVTSNVKIGCHSQLNNHSVIGHDSIVGNYFTSAAGVVINGECSIGECVYFGSNSCIKQNLKVIKNTKIGMGSTVIKNIKDSGVYFGNPVKKIF